jgi:TolA-binding protein
VSLSGFVNFSLALTLLYAWIYFNASIALTDKIEERKQIYNLNSKLAGMEEEKKFLRYQIDDLSYQMSVQLRTELVGKMSDKIRKPASLDLDELSIQRLDSARKKVQQGKFAKALNDLEEIEEKFPRSRVLIEVLLLKADVLRVQGKSLEAIEIYENIVELYPERSHAGIALFRLGELAEINKDFKEAKAYFSILSRQFSSFRELSEKSAKKLEDIQKAMNEFRER